MTRLLTVRVVMERTGLSRSQVYKLATSGEVRAMKGVTTNESPSANWLFSEESLEAWQQRRLHAQTTSPRAFDADAALPAVKEPTFQ